jgi:predicted RND superfamily exporter protein
VFLITHLLRFSVKHPRVVITLVGAITVCALVFIPRIQLRLDGRSLIPAGLPQFAEGDEAASRFELRDLVLIGVGNEQSGVYTPETLRRIARLSDGLSRVEGVVKGSVVSLSTVPRVTLVDGKVDTGPLFRPEDQLDTETIIQLRRDVGRRGYDTGLLVSRDGKGAAIIAKVEPGADRYRLLEETRALIASESFGKDSVYLSGSALAQAVLGQATASDLAADFCCNHRARRNAVSIVSPSRTRAFVAHGNSRESRLDVGPDGSDWSASVRHDVGAARGPDLRWCFR